MKLVCQAILDAFVIPATAHDSNAFVKDNSAPCIDDDQSLRKRTISFFHRMVGAVNQASEGQMKILDAMPDANKPATYSRERFVSKILGHR
jgi:hypothetical protein